MSSSAFPSRITLDAAAAALSRLFEADTTSADGYFPSLERNAMIRGSVSSAASRIDTPPELDVDMDEGRFDCNKYDGPAVGTIVKARKGEDELYYMSEDEDDWDACPECHHKLNYAQEHPDEREDDDDEVDFSSEVQSLFTLSSASASLSSLDDSDDDEEEVQDEWADEDTADLRGHRAEGWNVPKPKNPLGKRRRVEQIVRVRDDSDSEEEVDEVGDEIEVDDSEAVEVEPRSPIKQLPKRARTGDVVYSTELTQSIPLGFGSAPTFSRPFEMQDVETEVWPQGSASRELPSWSSEMRRRVFYAPGEVAPTL